MEAVQARKQRMIAGALTDQEVRSARIEELKMLFTWTSSKMGKFCWDHLSWGSLSCYPLVLFYQEFWKSANLETSIPPQKKIG